ncbi:hypothetical protein AVEN_113250-1 [Araneus ventricosus]|uniref:Uncharacterized protein n=1 Tax=Araneus ventricosus TaxID=182803 RepID=A0A4Y2HGZ4_ARAVE|nr:hypothetical protein AVEN_113250-1 [Araneus ventricosus]
MAEGGSDISNVDDETLFKEEFAHVEELLISSREECIEISSKFQDVSMKVESMMRLRDDSSSDHSVSSEHLEQEKESRNDYEELKSKYASRMLVYKESSEHQARIVDVLQSRSLLSVTFEQLHEAYPFKTQIPLVVSGTSGITLFMAAMIQVLGFSRFAGRGGSQAHSLTNPFKMNCK